MQLNPYLPPNPPLPTEPEVGMLHGSARWLSSRFSIAYLLASIGSVCLSLFYHHGLTRASDILFSAGGMLALAIFTLSSGAVCLVYRPRLTSEMRLLMPITGGFAFGLAPLLYTLVFDPLARSAQLFDLRGSTFEPVAMLLVGLTLSIIVQLSISWMWYTRTTKRRGEPSVATEAAS